MSSQPKTKIGELVSRFNETVAWCALKKHDQELPYDGVSLARKFREEKWSQIELESRLVLSETLRSTELKPQSQESLQSLSQWATSVESLVVKRSIELAERKDRTSRRSDSGRIMLYAPQENLCDGAAQVLSLGFFDIDNTPPWDTWVVMAGQYLLAWVPGQMVGFAEAGIEVNPEQCILWADSPIVAGTEAAYLAKALEKQDQ